MKASHTVVLTEDDIIRAITKHVASKVPNAKDWELTVTIQWRARKAIVEARRAVPTLTQAVEIEGHTA